jgi:hypothetical protein
MVPDRVTLPVVRDQCQAPQHILEACVSQLLLRRLTNGPRSRAGAIATGQKPTTGKEKSPPGTKRSDQTRQRLARSAHTRCTNMLDHTTNPYVCKATTKLLVCGLMASGSKVIEGQDCRPHNLGWQTFPHHGELRRNRQDAGISYRRPRATGGGGNCNSCKAQCSGHSLKDPTP